MDATLLHEIIYVSLASEEMDAWKLDRLLSRCRSQNEETGITGVLVHHERSILQFQPRFGELGKRLDGQETVVQCER